MPRAGASASRANATATRAAIADTVRVTRPGLRDINASPKFHGRRIDSSRLGRKDMGAVVHLALADATATSSMSRWRSIAATCRSFGSAGFERQPGRSADIDPWLSAGFALDRYGHPLDSVKITHVEWIDIYLVAPMPLLGCDQTVSKAPEIRSYEGAKRGRASRYW